MCAGESLSRSYSRGVCFAASDASAAAAHVLMASYDFTSCCRLPALHAALADNRERKCAENHNDAARFFLKLQSAFRYFQTVTVSECRLIKLLLYILFEKCIDLLPLEMASRGNRRCANCTGTLSFPLSLNSACWVSVSLSSFLQSTAQCY